MADNMEYMLGHLVLEIPLHPTLVMTIVWNDDTKYLHVQLGILYNLSSSRLLGE